MGLNKRMIVGGQRFRLNPKNGQSAKGGTIALTGLRRDRIRRTVAILNQDFITLPLSFARHRIPRFDVDR